MTMVMQICNEIQPHHKYLTSKQRQVKLYSLTDEETRMLVSFVQEETDDQKKVETYPVWNAI